MMINGFNPSLSLLNAQFRSPQAQPPMWSSFQQPTLQMPMASDALQLNSINMGLFPGNPLALSSLSPRRQDASPQDNVNQPPALSAATFGNIPSFGGQLMNSVNNAWNSAWNTLGGSFSLGGSPMSASIGPAAPMQLQSPVRQVQQPPLSLQNTPMIRSPQQIFQNIGSGAQQAFQDIGSLIRDHGSGVMGFGGGMALATAVCPFAGGALAATGASALANRMAQSAA